MIFTRFHVHQNPHCVGYSNVANQVLFVTLTTSYCVGQVLHGLKLFSQNLREGEAWERGSVTQKQCTNHIASWVGWFVTDTFAFVTFNIAVNIQHATNRMNIRT